MTPRRMSVGFQLRAAICFIVGFGLGWYAGQQVNFARKLRVELDNALLRAQVATRVATTSRQITEELRARAGPGVTVEPFREDYRNLLGRAAISISQGGYNTTMEVIAAGVPAVLAPHAAEKDSEQGLRARLLSERGAITLAESPDAAGLARAVDAAMAGHSTGSAGVDMGGAVATARLIAELLRKGSAPAKGRS